MWFFLEKFPSLASPGEISNSQENFVFLLKQALLELSPTVEFFRNEPKDVLHHH